MYKSLLQIEDWAGRENRKSFYLAFLRVAISVWLLKELLIDWPDLTILYGSKSFLVRNDNIINGIPFFRAHYMILVYVFIVFIVLNILGIGRWMTALTLLILSDIFQQLNPVMVNGGDKMARLVILYMVFANSYDYFVLYKSKPVKDPGKKRFINIVSNAAAYSLMLQLCITYFCTGLGKLYNEVWRNGTALYYAMSLNRFAGTAWNAYLVQNTFFVKTGTYFTLLFELTFPFLIWVKKCRMPLIIAGVILHLAIYIFLMLYGFEVVFILLLGLFFSNEDVLRFVNRFYKL
ncbi:HTTM domain-containing protein [Ferruginibacter albus]|uniref:HTTM domain-containing protein n=1 Tax=Ferruginibacter albus TaxID=2875540 RepID=UPI001CC728D9|nr:HTTM domain-containing protein [Ferruginibacter albus]UAY50877.1 HTTM domain-containing protein [Ferruginibacter albus]